jgi:hypothetical protein
VIANANGHRAVDRCPRPRATPAGTLAANRLPRCQVGGGEFGGTGPHCAKCSGASSERVKRLKDFLQGFNVTSQDDLQRQHVQHIDAARLTLAGHREGVRQVRSELLAGTLKMAEKYTRAADQQGLAASAMHMLASDG